MQKLIPMIITAMLCAVLSSLGTKAIFTTKIKEQEKVCQAEAKKTLANYYKAFDMGFDWARKEGYEQGFMAGQVNASKL